MAALALAAFCFGTTESLPIGLLPLISSDLHVSPSAAGLIVTGYGLVVAAASVPLVRLTANVRRRRLLAVVMALFVVTTLATATSPGYAALLGTRLVTALLQAVFWPVAMIAAAGLVRPERRGRAAAYVFTGGSLAVALGVPLGTWLGHLAGWRISFVLLAILCLAAFAAITILLPEGRPGQSPVSTASHPDAAAFWWLMIAVSLSVGGVFTAYTYITEFMTRVAGFPGSALGPLMFACGVADVIGLAVAGVLVDRAPRLLLLASSGAMPLALLGLYAIGDLPAPAIALFVLLAAAIPGLATAMQGRVLETAPGSTDIGSAWASGAFNVGIAGGAALGGSILSLAGARGTPLAGLVATSAAFLILAVPPSSRTRETPRSLARRPAHSSDRTIPHRRTE